MGVLPAVEDGRALLLRAEEAGGAAKLHVRPLRHVGTPGNKVFIPVRGGLWIRGRIQRAMVGCSCQPLWAGVSCKVEVIDQDGVLHFASRNRTGAGRLWAQGRAETVENAVGTNLQC